MSTDEQDVVPLSKYKFSGTFPILNFDSAATSMQTRAKHCNQSHITSLETLSKTISQANNLYLLKIKLWSWGVQITVAYDNSKN